MLCCGRATARLVAICIPCRWAPRMAHVPKPRQQFHLHAHWLSRGNPDRMFQKPNPNALFLIWPADFKLQSIIYFWSTSPKYWWISIKYCSNSIIAHFSLLENVHHWSISTTWQFPLQANFYHLTISIIGQFLPLDNFRPISTFNFKYLAICISQPIFTTNRFLLLGKFQLLVDFYHFTISILVNSYYLANSKTGWFMEADGCSSTDQF